MIKRRFLGFSLLEMVLVCAIILIVAALSIPVYDQMVKAECFKARVMRFYRHLQYARHLSITKNREVTVCPVGEAGLCGNTWGKGYLILLGENIHFMEKMLKEAGMNSVDSLIFKSFPSRYFLKFTPKGTTAYQNGTFYFYPSMPFLKPQRIIVSQTGRMRIEEGLKG